MQRKNHYRAGLNFLHETVQLLDEHAKKPV